MPRRNRNARQPNKNKRSPTPFSLAHLEQVVSNEPLAAEECTPLDTPCSIHIHSKRKRLVDADGVSGKAAIDGLVHAGLLPDDSSEFVTEVTYSQEKSNEEETIITIISIEKENNNE